MPTHPRQTIREALVALLVAAGTSAGSNVVDSRAYAKAATAAIFVSIQQDDFNEYTALAPRTLDRTARILIECVVADVSDPEDSLDTLCREVELAIDSDFLLAGGGTPRLLLNQYEGTTISPPDADGARKVFGAAITYLATYRDQLT